MTLPTAHIPVLALIALAALFGHDALMSADPHGTVAGASHDVRSHEAGDHPADAAFDGCHQPEGARPASGGPIDPSATADRATGMTITGDGGSAYCAGWSTPPGKAPDVLRALLQVFLN